MDGLRAYNPSLLHSPVEPGVGEMKQISPSGIALEDWDVLPLNPNVQAVRE